MPLRGCICVFNTSDLFYLFVIQPVKPAMADDPAIAAADFRNFLLVELTILRLCLQSIFRIVNIQ